MWGVVPDFCRDVSILVSELFTQEPSPCCFHNLGEHIVCIIISSLIINPNGISRHCLPVTMAGNGIILLLWDRYRCDGIIVDGLVTT